jgi:hypothetical protein
MQSGKRARVKINETTNASPFRVKMTLRMFLFDKLVLATSMLAAFDMGIISNGAKKAHR